MYGVGVYTITKGGECRRWECIRGGVYGVESLCPTFRISLFPKFYIYAKLTSVQFEL